MLCVKEFFPGDKLLSRRFATEGVNPALDEFDGMMTLTT
jgi:hypothetical protein